MEAARVLLFPFPATPFQPVPLPDQVLSLRRGDRPVVTNRVGEVAELLGKLRFYYRAGDVEDMARACQRALEVEPSFPTASSLDALTWEQARHHILSGAGRSRLARANHPSRFNVGEAMSSAVQVAVSPVRSQIPRPVVHASPATSIFWLVAEACQAVGGIAVAVIIARHLGPENFGRYGAAIGLATLAKES